MKTAQNRCPHPRNLLLCDGIFLVPAAGFADTLPHAVLFCILFFAVMTVPVLLTSCLPQRISMTLRSLVYSVLAALVYIPVMLLFLQMPDHDFTVPQRIVYLAVTVTSVLASARRSQLLNAQTLTVLLKDLAVMLLSGILFVLLLGTLRELLGFGSVGGRMVLQTPPLPAMQYPFSGMMLAVLFTALLVPRHRQESEECV